MPVTGRDTNAGIASAISALTPDGPSMLAIARLSRMQLAHDETIRLAIAAAAAAGRRRSGAFAPPKLQGILKKLAGRCGALKGIQSR